MQPDWKEMTRTVNDDLIKFIEECFSDTIYPGDDNLFKDYYDPDIPTFKRIVRGKHWKETFALLDKLDGSDFQFFHNMYPFLTNEALHFYAPAFLTISLVKANPDVFADAFFSALDFERNEPDPTPFADLMRLFSARQKQAIALTMRCLYGDEDISLGQYWSQWLPSPSA